MKKIVIVLFIVVGTLFLGNQIFSYSFAYEYEIDNAVLFYKDDYVELERDIEKYLENIDDIVIPNSSFLYADELADNYDFLVRFAIDYVMNNQEYYYGGIKKFASCSYIDKRGVGNLTDDYVELSTIYDITDFYFGMRDFIIINEDVCVKDDYVSLSDYASDEFEFKIVDVSVTGSESEIKAVVSYDSGDEYLYSFYNDNNVLKLRNVEVAL